MGNLDFLEKKTRYDLIWDGITEGKVTATSANTPTYYLISEKDYAPDNIPDELKSLTSGVNSAKQNNIDVVFNWTLADNDDPNSIEYGKNLATLFKLEGSDAINCIFNCKTDDFMASLCYAAYDGADFGDATLNPSHGVVFPKKGWYINDFGIANTKLATVEMPKKNPIINISGKGFTSPQKPYRYVSRSVKPDDDICIGINYNKIPSTDEEKSKGFNSFCDVKNPNIEMSISLNEDLANILKHCRRGSLSLMEYNHNDDGKQEFISVEVDSDISTSIDIVPKAINKINGISIEKYGDLVYFNPSISIVDFFAWYEKYFSTEP